MKAIGAELPAIPPEAFADFLTEINAPLDRPAKVLPGEERLAAPRGLWSAKEVKSGRRKARTVEPSRGRRSERPEGQSRRAKAGPEEQVEIVRFGAAAAP